MENKEPSNRNEDGPSSNFVEDVSDRLKALATHRNTPPLLRFLGILAGLVTAYSLIFQVLMAYEGQQHSLVTGFYWTLSTMSTLGYGDISFITDAGRLFSILVLLSGMIFMLVLLPFTFIELFYNPWMEARAASQIPRRVPDTLEGHVILTFYGPVASALIAKLEHFNYPYVVILPELEEVSRLTEAGVNVIYGDLDDPRSYINARVEQAAMVATTRTDIINTTVVFTVRGITDKPPVIATARDSASVDVLELAGCTRVLDLTLLIAEALARRTVGGRQFTHIVGKIDDMVVAEVEANRTTLVGMGYQQAQWATSVSIVGFWARGEFEVGEPESTIEPNTVLVMAGTRHQLREFDNRYQAEDTDTEEHPVIVIGGGRVGRATAAALKRRGIDSCIVEQLAERIIPGENYVHGSAADKSVLERAGIEDAAAVIITTRDDETNIYLTIFCRLLRDDIQIISRATLERNVTPLHRAGCDIVMSYSSMGANALFNLLHRSDILLVAEGLDIFKVPVPESLVGKTLEEANIRHLTGCSVIGIDRNDSSKDKTITNPRPDSELIEGGEIVLIGTPAGETEFLKTFPSKF